MHQLLVGTEFDAMQVLCDGELAFSRPYAWQVAVQRRLNLRQANMLRLRHRTSQRTPRRWCLIRR